MAASLAAALVCGLWSGQSLAAAKKVSLGKASWYKMGTRTANGERFNPNGLTAAHRTLKFGTKVRVTNLRNGKSVVVRINDRGPFIRSRIIDVSMGAARQIGLTRMGVAKVKVEVLR
ncbi:MAG: septal ring lytic transglycosylase RlpA family protein [Rhizobiales bacterium]|nr:septal ring lytic transglycosylase RlpA family protein [Hyphomicrobiales bacterium]